MESIDFRINKKIVKGKPGETIMDVAGRYGIYIPSLCYDPCLESIGSCRVCIVEDEKSGRLFASCVTPISPGMSVFTNSEAVLEARKVVVKLMLASHPESCILCGKGNRCKLRAIASELGIGINEYYPMPNYSGTKEENRFILRDLSKCILCAKCIRADHTLVVEGAIDYIDRGFEARPAVFMDGPLEKSECTFCGTCVEICPTGAIFEKYKRYRGSASIKKSTTCSLCACGCSYWFESEGGEVVGVRPGIQGSVNGITLCVKGHYGYDYINNPERLKLPLVRKEGKLVPSPWDEATAAAADKLSGLMKRHPGSIAVIAGPHCTNEEAFLLKSFASGVLKTDYAYSGLALSQSNLIKAMEDETGSVGPSCTIKEIEDMDAVLVIGANPAETAPVLGYSIKRAVKSGKAGLIVVDPVGIKLTRHASYWLRPFVNTDVLLLSAFIKIILEHKDIKKILSKSKPGNIAKALKIVKKISLEEVEKKTGVSLDVMKDAAELFIKSGKRVIVFGNGICRQSGGMDLVRTLCTLGKISGLLTKKDAAIFPVMYQSNALGGYHMGLSGVKGSPGLLEEIENGNIKGLWTIGYDPFSSISGTDAIDRIFNKLEFLIVSDSFLTSIGEKADIVLASSTAAEKSGTITNMEGRVQRIQPAILPVGQSLGDFEVISHVAWELGSPFKYKMEKDVTKDIIKKIPQYSKMPLPKKNDLYFSYQLPVLLKKGKGSFYIPENPAAPSRDKKFPYKLIVGSVLFQLGSGGLTGFSSRLSGDLDIKYIELNPGDAEKRGVKEGDYVLLKTTNGEKQFIARLNKSVPAGVIFLPRPFMKDSGLLPASADGINTKHINVSFERRS